MKKVLKIDNQGFFLEEVILEDDELTPSDCIEVEYLQGFQKPKWNGTAWVEGLSQAEIAELNKPKQQEPTEKDRIEALELALLEML